MTAPRESSVGTSARARAAHGVKRLHPGYFALVMATGILSVGMDAEGATWISAILLWIAILSYTVLVVLSIWRIIAFRADVAADLGDPGRAFGFFTFVAATDVLGTRLVGTRLFSDETPVWASFVLLVTAVLVWLVLGYLVPAMIMRRDIASPALRGANGTWFIWVVASQSIAVLAANLEPLFITGRNELALIAVFSWSVGLFLYLTVLVIVVVRLLVYRLTPEAATPPYWVAMGATAITVVAGAKIVEMADAPMIDVVRELVAGLAVLFWAFGTWLIPALIAGGYWRHVRHRVPLRYEPSLWSIVFPLGMYGVGSTYLGVVDALPIVETIGRVELWLALVVWAAVFVAMLAHFARSIRRAPPP